MSRKIKFVIAALFIIVSAVLFFLFYKQIIKVNTPSEKAYPVRGVDVSSYQGEIDRSVLSQGPDFAFIKATEGSGHVDGCFESNFSHARENGLKVGAYHFFSFDSGGDTQAENFISQVGAFDGMLPPVIDVEFYGEYRQHPKPADKVVPELRRMADDLEQAYGLRPIFYATGSAYKMYIKDNFPDCGLWIRNVYLRPSEDTDCLFRQYSGTGRLGGYSGEEKYIDLNVFRGTREEFYNLFG